MSAYECRKCNETFQKGVDLSMHYRVIHVGPLQMGLAEECEHE